jgi:hypothetical protein
MDSQHFAKHTSPSLLPFINEEALGLMGRRIEVPDKRIVPSEDVRYPGYASVMEDGRLVTDYRSQCEYNVAPSKYGNSLRSWLQHNGEAMVQTSRHRQAERAGAYYYGANTKIPPKQLQICDPFECTFSTTGIPGSLGLERKESNPSHFGTFARESRTPLSKRVFLTDVPEGGRNTPHGRQFTPLGNQSFNPRKTGYGATG